MNSTNLTAQFYSPQFSPPNCLYCTPTPSTAPQYKCLDLPPPATSSSCKHCTPILAVNPAVRSRFSRSAAACSGWFRSSVAASSHLSGAGISLCKRAGRRPD
ncbi:hypothetical protein GDO78_002211 [Eleutherodactylus coqui]|uniref:Uncharacterized protein n=1 Tax=Eleutherodactylus coqui TaxID=57060 RepID=A0A8J6EVY3_ELECQ|nr:hypothetical protein GDO78_002211 [Eleutherodactylus coqui]